MQNAQVVKTASSADAARFAFGILFFGTLWGASEAILGGWLYQAGVPYASVPLAIIAFAVMTIGRVWLPRPGTCTMIAACAMLYKFFNSPFFACHLVGILLLGVAYDAVFGLARRLPPAVKAAVATYLGFALFAGMMTWIVRYPHWAGHAPERLLRHIGISGTLAAAANAFMVPLAIRFAEWAKGTDPKAGKVTTRLPVEEGALIVVGLWILGFCLAL